MRYFLPDKMRVTKPLIVMDFDETIVDVDSGRQMLNMIDAGSRGHLTKHHLRPDHDAMCQIFESGRGRDDLVAELVKMPLTAGMAQFFKYLASIQDSVDCIVLSDATTFSIREYLKHHDAEKLFQEIISNDTLVSEQGNVSVLPACAPHDHAQCPPNMCKGLLLRLFRDRMRARNVHYDRVWYIGDGRNDFCPCSQLTASDCVFARRNFPLERKIVDKDEAERARVVAEVVIWDSAADIEKKIQMMMMKDRK